VEQSLEWRIRNRQWRKERQREQTEEPEVLERSFGKQQKRKIKDGTTIFMTFGGSITSALIDHRH
jgi:hypothetical protein